MSSLPLVIAVLVVFGLLLAVLQRLRPSSSPLAYESRGALFSPAERSFYGVLQQALGDDHVAFGKVRLGDVVQPTKGLDRSGYQTALNKINRKHLDFVICRAGDLSLVAAVELDDKSHRRTDRGERDAFVDEALASAGIPLLRFAAKKGYELGEVKERLAECFGVESTQVESSAKSEQEVAAANADLLESPSPFEAEARLCPACQAPMVKRQAKNGPNAGNWFWACSTFPKCRKALSIEN